LVLFCRFGKICSATSPNHAAEISRGSAEKFYLTTLPSKNRREKESESEQMMGRVHASGAFCLLIGKNNAKK
jgi:hypothetical protein